jgi:hypothetical protein
MEITDDPQGVPGERDDYRAGKSVGKTNGRFMTKKATDTEVSVDQTFGADLQ